MILKDIFIRLHFGLCT